MSLRVGNRKRHTVEVRMLLQSTPVVLTGVKDTYQRGRLFCVMCDDGSIYKFPIRNIYRVKEF